MATEYTGSVIPLQNAGNPFDAALEKEGVTGPMAQLARSIYKQESGGGTNTTTSNAGAVGHMQVIPATFKRFSDEGWNITDPEHNIRAGLRYIKALAPIAGNDPKLIAAGYYGGEGAIPLARRGVPIKDPRNPNAPDTIQYGDQVAARLDQAPATPQQTAQEYKGQVIPLVNTDAKPKATFTPGAEGFKQSMREAIEADVWPTGARLIAGAGTALDNAALRAKQIFSKLTPQDENQVLANRAITDSGAGMVGNIAGSVAMLGAPVGAATRALAPQVARVLPNVIAPTVAAAGVNAAVAPSVTPLMGNESAIENAAIGAAGGALGDIIPRVAARAVQPIMQSDAVRRLLGEGIVPTPGQAAGANSFLGRTEQKLQSTPILGDMINASKDRANVELQRAAFARATPRGQQVTTRLGREGVEETADIISNTYQNALNAIGTVRFDNQLLGRLPGAMRQAAPAMTPAQLNDVGQVVRNIISNGQRPAAGTTVTADVAKGIDQTFGQVIREIQRSPNSPPMAAQALRAAQQEWRGLIRRSAPDRATAEMLDEANRAFANLIRVERASAKDLGTGQFNANQLARAVRESTPGSRRTQFAQGNALMQDLSDPAAEVMRNTVSNSGTTDRALLAYLFANPFKGMLAAGAGMAAAPVISRPGARYMVGDLIPGQGRLAELLRSTAPEASSVGQSSLMNLLQQGQP